MKRVLSDIDVVSLAVFRQSKQEIDPAELSKYGKAIWHSSAHNTGLLITRPQWNMIKDCFHVIYSNRCCLLIIESLKSYPI